jgi:hypothetical protein
MQIEENKIQIKHDSLVKDQTEKISQNENIIKDEL